MLPDLESRLHVFAEVIRGDGARLREFAVNKDGRGCVQLVGVNARRMQQYIDTHDALLFLQRRRGQGDLPADTGIILPGPEPA